MKNNSSFDDGKLKRIDKAVIEQKETDDLLSSPAFPSLLKKAQEAYQQRKKEEEAAPAPAPAPAPEPSAEEKLLTEIRDLLKEKK